MSERETIERVLSLPTWAVVGATPMHEKPSCFVTQYLIDHGYDVIPVNPDYDEVLGRRCYPSLRDVPRPVDVVELFRRRSHVGAHVDEAIEIGARAVWFQIGTTDPAAASRARMAGLLVVEDRCPKMEFPLFGRLRRAS